ncbi:MBL fold metallo-hydrolase [Nocardiopsis trehalosi]|uniref:MBL fold metallo-hydrolase n=1 Tax=Nocardiopsis trehalosi TaxID=109329 RepID=UPI00082DD9E9|nr:MBL fold metallo-hydrolase [Nocardiopsis trehalosi]
MRTTPPVEDLGGGVWSIPVPIPDNPLGHTLVYALDTPRGPVLIDTGWDHPDSWRALTDGLTRIGTGVREVHGAVLTHFHPDHTGLVARLRAASGAWTALHPADTAVVDRITAAHPDTHRAAERARLRRAGAPPGDADAATAWRPLPPVAVDRPLADGDTIDLGGRDLRVLWTPGHSPGHVCLHLPDTGRVFTGDHVLPRITPHIGLHPLDDTAADPLGAYLASLERLTATAATEVLPAHEHRFTGLADRAAAIAAHHEEKLDLLADALAGGPAPLWRLAAALPWRRPWADLAPGARRLAAAETAAHLRTLQRRGRARSTTGPDGAPLWAPPQAPAPAPAPRSRDPA